MSTRFTNEIYKYVERFNTKLYIHIDAIYILSTGFLLINLIPPSQLIKIIVQVKEAVIATNPEYDVVLKRLHLYYDMKLVTFGTDDDSDLIPFPIIVQSYSQALLTLYIIEIVQVPIID